MQKWLKFLLFLLLATYISYHFSFYKWIGYENIPETGIFDEHDYPAVGYSVRKTGIPTGWSNMDIYKILDDSKENEEGIGFDGISITKNNSKPSVYNIKDFNYPKTFVVDVDVGKGTETIRLVQPFLDHPFLGSLIFSLNSNPKKFDDFKPADYRQVALIASYITGILLFFYTYLIFNNIFLSTISIIIYSSAPTFILLSRFALFENLLIPFFLFSQILLLASLSKFKNPKKSLIILSGLIAGLAYLIKEPGLFVTLAGTFTLISQKHYKNLFHFLLPSILVVSLYYLYSFYLSPDLTLKLLVDQSNRGFFGALNFLYSIITPRFVAFPLESYWLFGFITLIMFLFTKTKESIIVSAGFISFTLMYVLVAGLNYPWYSIPFLPFFIIGISWFLYKLVTAPNILNTLLFSLLPLSSSFYWGYTVFHANENIVNTYRLLVFLPTIIYLITRKYNVPKFFWYCFMLIILYQLNKWNQQGFLYIITNWNKLPMQFSNPLT